jgi:glycosyltransferase involved in cell wall biosynthesis
VEHLVSVFLENLEFFDPEIGSLPVHGANLSVASLLQNLLAEPRVRALEVFLPPELILQKERLAQAARMALPTDRRGKGVLRFYPLHSLPEVWQDRQPRLLFTLDPEWMDRDRYLRDRFALGPTPLTCDTHALGQHRLWNALSRIAAAPPVAFDSIVCLSQACREALRASFDGFLNPAGAPLPCRLDLLPHGVYGDIFHPVDAEGRLAARRRLELPERGQIALYLGRVTPYGKADLLPLLRAFVQASDSKEDRLLIAGAENVPGYYQKLREAGDALGLGERLLFRPKTPPGLRPVFYAAADLFVFPGDTIQEAQGNTILEAMATGLPVIVSDWDGMRDLVCDGETGYLIPTWWMPTSRRIEALSPISPFLTDYLYLAQSVWVDSRRLTETLRAVLRSPDLRKRLGQAARERIEKHYTWPRVMDGWQCLWEELAGLAAAETPSEAQRRRDGAEALGLPTPYQRLFRHYASYVVAPAQAFRLSARGHAVLERRETLQFYEETLPLLRQNVLDALFAALLTAGPVGIRMEEMARKVADATAIPDDDVPFYLGLLLKHAYVEFAAVSA